MISRSITARQILASLKPVPFTQRLLSPRLPIPRTVRHFAPFTAQVDHSSAFTMGGSGDPYNVMLEHMLLFHNGFRAKIAMLSQGINGSGTLPKTALLRYLAIGGGLCQHLETHHMIEEMYIFPHLAKRLPQFGKEHIEEHKTMHVAVEELGNYVGQCMRKLQKVPNKGGKEDDAEWPKDVYDEDKMRNSLKYLSDTLLPHLQHEEASLAGKVLREAGFTLQEVARMASV